MLTLCLRLSTLQETPKMWQYHFTTSTMSEDKDKNKADFNTFLEEFVEENGGFISSFTHIIGQ